MMWMKLGMGNTDVMAQMEDMDGELGIYGWNVNGGYGLEQGWWM